MQIGRSTNKLQSIRINYQLKAKVKSVKTIY